MENEKNYDENVLELEMPDHALKTLKRLWQSSKKQHARLYLVFASVVFYTLFSMVSPLYSAHLVDFIWNGVKEASGSGEAFHFTWQNGGAKLLTMLTLYFMAWLFF